MTVERFSQLLQILITQINVVEDLQVFGENYGEELDNDFFQNLLKVVAHTKSQNQEELSNFILILFRGCLYPSLVLEKEEFKTEFIAAKNKLKWAAKKSSRYHFDFGKVNIK